VCLTAQQRAAVVGMGTMGSGIVEVLLVSGYFVDCVDSEREVIQSSKSRLRENLEKSKEKGRLNENPEDLLSRLRTGTDIQMLRGHSFAVEAIVEDYEEKCKVLRQVEALFGSDAILSTNTSSLSITRLSDGLQRPAQFVGMHFFNPAPRMPLIEVIRGTKTSEDTLRFVTEMANGIGKTPIVVKDSPGFVVNRLLIPYILEAGRLLEEGVASAGDIDTCMKLGAGLPMGPLELADLIGIDVVVQIGNQFIEDGIGELPVRVPNVFRELLDKNRTGRKTRGGFYDYYA
jgi:3-hydroxybutyryl-CoA dehydrogenase